VDLRRKAGVKMAEGSTIPVFRRPAGQAKAGPLIDADPDM
jgi:hypothetical protein